MDRIGAVILGAIGLEKGGTYVIELDVPISRETLDELRRHLDTEEARLGVQFLLLAKGLRIARVEHKGAVTYQTEEE